MAFYNSTYYESWGGGYDSAPTQSSFSYDYNSLFNYDPSPASTPYYYASHSVSVPSFLQHTPALSQSVVSYSTADFNEPEFDEYDPTPYGGGYDIVSTYGKPLPPSDNTCYRRDGATSLPSVPPPPPKEEVKSKETPPKEEIKVNSEHDAPTIAENETGMGYHYPFAYDTQSGYGYGYGYGYDESVSCPCGCHGQDGGRESQPSWSANYIFGCSRYPYGQGREFGGNYPNPIFGYERHYQEQSLQGELQYQQPQFLNVSTNFLHNNSSYYP